MGGNADGTGTGCESSHRTAHNPAPLKMSEAAKQTSNTAITTKRHLRESCFLKGSLSDNSQPQRVSWVSLVTSSCRGVWVDPFGIRHGPSARLRQGRRSYLCLMALPTTCRSASTAAPGNAPTDGARPAKCRRMAA